MHLEWKVYFMIYFLQIDVGGQRGERRQWIKLFEGVENLFLIYLVAVSEFDQVLEEDQVTNRYF